MSNETTTTAADIERSKQNGDVRVRILLGNDEQIQRIAEALQTYTNHLCSVSLVACDLPNATGTGWIIPDLTPILTAIESLPRVVHLQFENSSVHGWTLRAPALTTFLQTTRLRLETLDFTAVRVEGTREELQALDKTISGLVCLRGCCLQNNFLLWLNDAKQIYPLDQMLQGIARLPLLQEVYIDLDHWNDDAHQSQLSCSSTTLKTILSSSSIQDYFLGKLDPTHPAVQDIANALAAPAANNHIRFLSLQFKPSSSIKSNNKSKPTPIEKSLECLAQALKVNTSLQELRLSFGSDASCPNLDSFLVVVANSLSQNVNTNLTKLEVVSPCNYGIAVEEAYVKLLRSNYTLVELEFYSNLGDKYVSLDGSHRTEMHLYLSLNSDGRKRLMQTYQRKPWVNALANQSNNLDALFYYLSINPWLVSREQDTTATRKRRRMPSDSQQQQQQQQASARKIQRLEDEIQRLQRENEALKQQGSGDRLLGGGGGCVVM